MASIVCKVSSMESFTGVMIWIRFIPYNCFFTCFYKRSCLYCQVGTFVQLDKIRHYLAYCQTVCCFCEHPRSTLNKLCVISDKCFDNMPVESLLSLRCFKGERFLVSQFFGDHSSSTRCFTINICVLYN